AGKGSEASIPRHILKFGDREPAAIGRADQRAHARSGNDANWNPFLFEDLQNSYVGDATGEASAQRQANRRNTGSCIRTALAGEFPPKGLYRPNDLAQTLHSEPHISG